ncbi:CopG family transcriptional regulator [Streptomyces sp. NPDC021020]|uniref:CopG family transcriptional regulator n=1 Tax=Streptomyces sp. NPDC021020 TaxID=3365109 RepID=UPI0037B33FBA
MTEKRRTARLPEQQPASAREHAVDGEPSASVTDARTHQNRIDRLGELSDWLQEQHGPATEEELTEAPHTRKAAQARIATQLAAAQGGAA